MDEWEFRADTPKTGGGGSYDGACRSYLREVKPRGIHPADHRSSGTRKLIRPSPKNISINWNHSGVSQQSAVSRAGVKNFGIRAACVKNLQTETFIKRALISNDKTYQLRWPRSDGMAKRATTTMTARLRDRLQEVSEIPSWPLQLILRKSPKQRCNMSLCRNTWLKCKLWIKIIFLYLFHTWKEAPCGYQSCLRLDAAQFYMPADRCC